MFKKLFGREQHTDLYQPRMPEVDIHSTIDTVFEQARSVARGGGMQQAYIAVVTPGRMVMEQACPPPGSMPPKQVAGMEAMLPPKVRRNIAVIAYTELKAITMDINKTIPFAGMMMGFAYIGHTVWIFEGHPSALTAGCRDADLLIVDSEMVPFLQPDWMQVAGSSMRRKEIYIHDRGSFQLKPVK